MKNRMSKVIKSVLLMLAFCVMSCKSTSNKPPLADYNSKDVSIISVIANPNRFHKKSIHIKGYFTMETEGEAVYISKNDYEKTIFKNAISLYIPYSAMKEFDIKEPYKGYVEIEGTFNKNLKGSYNLFSGGLENIVKINRLYKRGSNTEEFDME